MVLEPYYNMRNEHKNKCLSRGREQPEGWECRRIRNEGVMGLLVRQCRGSSTLGVEHS